MNTKISSRSINNTGSRIYQKGDWFLYLLLFSAVICLPLSIADAKWVPEANRLVYVTLWAALAGVVLAHTQLPGSLNWLIGTVLGIEYSIQFAGKLLPSFDIIWDDFRRFALWLWDIIVYRSPNTTIPFARSGTFVLSQSQSMINRLAAWYQAAMGSVTPADTTEAAATAATAAINTSALRDNTALWLGVAFVVWMLTWNAAYELFRGRRTFVALLPLGVGLVTNVSFTYIGILYVQIYLAVTLLTLVWSNIGRIQTIWTRLNLDFSNELKRDVVLAGSAISTVVFVAALITPYVIYDDAMWAFWNRFGPRLKAFYNDLDRIFAGRNPVPTPTPSPKTQIGGHTLTGGVQLSKKRVFSVKTNEPGPPPPEDLEQILASYGEEILYVPQHYWREITYDAYTGHGWDNSNRQTQQVEAGRPWTSLSYTYKVLTQTFTMAGTRRDPALAVNELVSVDRPYRVFTRGPGDFVGLSVDASSYTVVSWVPEVYIEDLRAASQDYPPEIKGRYLQLPKIPARVREMAESIVREAQANTPYDKARAIENYLRGFEYDLNLAPPPMDADVVDYFLFTAKRGYCDYSATAMVVMLRAVGVPARYASGYAMGTFDHNENAWLVNEDDAHAWAEVYFPGYGWIEFEPTPVRHIFVYPSNRYDVIDLSELLAQQRASKGIRIPAFWWAAGGLALLLLFVIIWPPRWFRGASRSPQQIVWHVYNSLVRRASWAGLGPRDGQTPSEYLRALSREVEQRLALAVDSRRDFNVINQTYQLARYSQAPITINDSDRVQSAWRRLRGLLLRLIFVKKR